MCIVEIIGSGADVILLDVPSWECTHRNSHCMHRSGVYVSDWIVDKAMLGDEHGRGDPIRSDQMKRKIFGFSNIIPDERLPRFFLIPDGKYFIPCVQHIRTLS